MMRNVIRGLKSYQDPEAATEGFGGTYFFRDEAGKRVAIMKPCDEEPLAPNNPKGFVGRFLGDPGLKPTVRVGEAASREVAAYLLDKDGFARVPHTVMVEMAHPIFHYQSDSDSGRHHNNKHHHYHSDCDCPEHSNKTEMATDGGGSDEMELQNLQAKLKVGSLQEFVPHACDTSELGASRFSAADVQRIGILDIRLFNTDRHAGNILVQKVPSGHHHHDHHHHGGHSFLGTDSYKLVPIDHGFALPEALEPPYFEWQHWPQAMLPFGKEELAYIGALDADADVAMLRSELPTLREESLRLLQVTTVLLKKCATAGLSLNEIANVVTRPLIGLDEEPSELEKICFAALDQVELMASSSHVEEEDELTDLEEGDEDDTEDDVEKEEEMNEEEMKQQDGNNDDDGGVAISKRDSTTSPTKPCQAIAAHAHRRDTPCVSPSSSLSPSSSTEMPVSIKGVGVGTTTTTTRRRTAMMADDQLFSMDDEFTTTITITSSKSPAIGSPVGVSLKKIRTANANNKGSGGGKGYDASLAGSFDSMSIREGDEDSPLSSTATPAATSTTTNTPGGGSIMTPGASMENAKRSAFAGLPSTYVAGGGFLGVPRHAGSATTDSSGSKTGGGRNANKPRRRRRRIALGGGTRMGKVRAQAYPPLVESRATATTGGGGGGDGSSNGAAASAASANAIFSGFSEEAWKVFLQLVCDSIDAAIIAGTWKQASPSKQAQMMSCPRF
jgi:hypothetical protein